MSDWNPMPDIELTTDQNGMFSGTIVFMYQDEVASITVSAPGYEARVIGTAANLSLLF
jgi:hypothetical protein